MANASKEDARDALHRIDTLRHEIMDIATRVLRLSTDLKDLEDFVDAAGRRLPTAKAHQRQAKRNKKLRL